MIYSTEEGYCWIVSNAHVVGTDAIMESKQFSKLVVLEYSLTVTMPDGKKVAPKEIMINRFSKDFAIIIVPHPGGKYLHLPTTRTAPIQGQKVYAMGHPKGLDYTFSSGVVSGVRTTKTKLQTPYEVIQTDASINSGNSGGALVDENCNLVGINTFSLYRKENAQGLNFAISTAKIGRSLASDEMVVFPLETSKIGPFLDQLSRGLPLQ